MPDKHKKWRGPTLKTENNELEKRSTHIKPNMRKPGIIGQNTKNTWNKIAENVAQK